MKDEGRCGRSPTRSAYDVLREVLSWVPRQILIMLNRAAVCTKNSDSNVLVMKSTEEQTSRRLAEQCSSR